MFLLCVFSTTDMTLSLVGCWQWSWCIRRKHRANELWINLRFAGLIESRLCTKIWRETRWKACWYSTVNAMCNFESSEHDAKGGSLQQFPYNWNWMNFLNVYTQSKQWADGEITVKLSNSKGCPAVLRSKKWTTCFGQMKTGLNNVLFQHWTVQTSKQCSILFSSTHINRLLIFAVNVEKHLVSGTGMKYTTWLL